MSSEDQRPPDASRPGEEHPGPAEGRRRKARSRRAKKAAGGLLGVGLDAHDGHRRVTTGEGFLLVGGSQETHERMTDIALRMKERLAKRGKTFGELSLSEFEDLGREVIG
jgi:hypothetical protein